MSLKKLLDVQLAIDIVVVPIILPYGVATGSILFKRYVIVPTLDVVIDAVNWGIISLYNIGRLNDKKDLIVRYTNKGGEVDAKALTAWVPLVIPINDILVGEGEAFIFEGESNGSSINLGIALQVLEVEEI